MNKYLKILLNNRGEVKIDDGSLPKDVVDPKVEPVVVEPIVEPIVTEPIIVEDSVPKTKEDWDKLKETDIQKWAELTQNNMNTVFRQNKELQDKVDKTTEQNNNLARELEKNRSVRSDIPVEPIDTGDKVYSIANLPKTKEEWDNLAIDDPILAVDLRYHANNQKVAANVEFQSAQEQSRKVLQKEHPDMYLAEVDENGNPKKDDKGNIVRKKAENGELFFDPKSEKGKIFEAIVASNPELTKSKEAPILVMSEMERRLRVNAQKVIDEDANRRQQVIDGQVITDGVPPPKAKIKVTFKDEAERKHAEKSVSEGRFASLEQWCEQRDNKDQGIYDENRTPTFG